MLPSGISPYYHAVNGVRKTPRFETPPLSMNHRSWIQALVQDPVCGAKKTQLYHVLRFLIKTFQDSKTLCIVNLNIFKLA